jgi:hypothetical protein
LAGKFTAFGLHISSNRKKNKHMKTITKEIKLYEFKELSEEARNKAINDRISWLAEIGWDSEEWKPGYVQEAIEECEKNKTPWFFADSIYNHGRDLIELELEDFEYYEDGTHHY